MKEILQVFRDVLPPGEVLGTAAREGVLCIHGLHGGAYACVAALLAGWCRDASLTPLIAVSTLDAAEDTAGDLAFFGVPDAEVFMPWDRDTEGGYLLEREAVHRTVSLLPGPSRTGEPLRVVPAAAVIQPLPPPSLLAAEERTIRRGDVLDPRRFAASLPAAGYERVPLVEHPGEYAVRGGIVDVYPLGSTSPWRMEFDGDTVASIRGFSPVTQESFSETPSCTFRTVDAGAVRRAIESGEGVSCDAYFSPDVLIVVDTPAVLRAAGELETALAGTNTPCFSFKSVLDRLAGRSGMIHLTELPYGRVPARKVPAAFPAADLFSRSGNPPEKIGEISLSGKVFVACQNPAEEKRLLQLIGQVKRKKRGNIRVFTASLSRGFTVPDRRLTVVTTREVFSRYKTRRPLRGRHLPASVLEPVHALRFLSEGDYVVHASHGIGIFRGLAVREHKGVKKEYLLVEYAGETLLYVPVTGIHLLQKYIGGTREKPPLDRLGGRRWKERRARVARAVEDIAAELLENHVARLRHRGIAYPPDTEWQHEFEASFMYEDTPDQVKALEEIKRDMESPVPMDRLLCGDVGFGKTELAVRAAFKAALAGKQTAVLVPTTVLAQQHYTTFTERMAEYPVTVDYLSRFKSPAEQRESIERLKRGVTDIIIGTHRLLSDDVTFKDLGLLIIDEEQRFGVEHKERLKRFRRTVDVLTLTATPIPRTLHMSLVGIKDISPVNTPPEERKPVITKVAVFSDALISRAIRYELSRNGQVFFLHNRVYNIDYYVDYIAKLVPEARVGKIHGRMKEAEIKENMRKFIRRETDVLVCTTIIESGIDLPNVNTLIVNDAHAFGLADLHQLRGRVGRFTRQAYAYLLIPPSESVAPEAAKRLKTIERYSALGSGFAIALQDLEIRGAGNLLGPEQSGHIAAVGYDLYCRILSAAVKRKKGETPEDPFRAGPEIDLPVSAYIPSSYVEDFRLKIEMYRRIDDAGTPEEVDEILRSFADRYGPPPPEVKRLLLLKKAAISARRKGIRRAYLKGRKLVCELDGASRPTVLPLPGGPPDEDALLERVNEKIVML